MNILLYFFICLGSSRCLGLDEVGLHVTLKVEVTQLVVLSKLKKGGKLSIRNNEASVIRALKVVGADISVDLLAYVSACHLSSLSLTKELGKLVTDAGRLDETRRLAVASALSTLGRCLGSSLQLTSNGLLKGLEITLHGREDAGDLLKLGAELVHLLLDARGLLNNLVSNRGSSGCYLLRGSLLGRSLSCCLLGGSLLSRGSSGSSLLSSLSGSNHSNIHSIYVFF